MFHNPPRNQPGALSTDARATAENVAATPRSDSIRICWKTSKKENDLCDFALGQLFAGPQPPRADTPPENELRFLRGRDEMQGY